jgi:predicted DNA-binding transcriptional regulator YafY
MRSIAHLDEKARDFSEVCEYKDHFDVADYSSKMFNMFSGESAKVKLLCHLDLREQIMDRFGAKIPLKAVDIDHFETVIDAAVSDGLVSWIMNFDDKIKVLEPESLALAVKERAQRIVQLY